MTGTLLIQIERLCFGQSGYDRRGVQYCCTRAAHTHTLTLPCCAVLCCVGDNLMYPTPMHDLSGWNIRSLSCGSTTFGIAASAGNEKSVISW
jgi:hypothetical protein